MTFRAGALACTDAARHYACLRGDGDPMLRAKRVSVEDLLIRTKEFSRMPFQYPLEATTEPFKRKKTNESAFWKKMRRGGLEDYAGTLHAQVLGTEEKYLELLTKNARRTEEMFVQIENVVREQCEAAHLRARQKKGNFGQKMYIDVEDRLEKLAGEHPGKVGRQPFEVLKGMAGLLTENCTIWWSEKFNLEDEQ
ncbi:MAG TPA: hypothetical protein VN673_15465 [Clostridia bacterium]|nr:hypothetical protein [Clostridia bacterium]